MQSLQKQHFVSSINFVVIMALLLSVGCSKVYYNTMEKFGVHKREIMIDRIRETKESQQEGEKQFVDSIEAIKSLTNFEGGDLEKTYDKFKKEYEKSKNAADEITHHIDQVEEVSEDLFREWKKELKKYSRKDLRDRSEDQLESTKEKYKDLMEAMREAERKTQPILSVMQDQVLFLKHNLNARAINSIKADLRNIDSEVDSLIRSMKKSIREAGEFIEEMNAQ